ncbi:hypothetical protein UT300007_17350 [Clostridium sp. CTA-7]
MGIIAVYFYPIKERDSIYYEMNLEKELNLRENEEIEEKLIDVIENEISLDCIDYLYDLEQHYVIYMRSRDVLSSAKKIYELLDKLLPQNSEIVIEISICNSGNYTVQEPIYSIQRNLGDKNGCNRNTQC